MLDDLLAVGQEEKLVCKRLQTCTVIRHEHFDEGQLLHAVARYCKVQQEGASGHLFNKAQQQSDLEGVEAVAVRGEEVVQREVPSILNEDASNFRAQGFEVDDNNNPAPKNLPGPNDNNGDCLYFPWGAKPLDARRAAGVRDVQPSMVNADATLHTVLGYFIHFLPVNYIETTMIPATNATISEALTWDFWSQDTPEMFPCAPYRLHTYMSRRRFELILKHLKFTTTDPPTFKNPFHNVNDLLEGWNQHTDNIVSALVG